MHTRATPKEVGDQKLLEKETPQGKNKTRSGQLQRILHGWAQWEKVKITRASLSKTQYTQKTPKTKNPLTGPAFCISLHLFCPGGPYRRWE